MAEDSVADAEVSYLKPNVLLVEVSQTITPEADIYRACRLAHGTSCHKTS